MSTLDQELLVQHLLQVVTQIKQGKVSSYVILTDVEALVVNNSIGSSLTSLEQLCLMPTVSNDALLLATFKHQMAELAAVADELHKQLVLNAKPKFSA